MDQKKQVHGIRRKISLRRSLLQLMANYYKVYVVHLLKHSMHDSLVWKKMDSYGRLHQEIHHAETVPAVATRHSPEALVTSDLW